MDIKGYAATIMVSVASGWALQFFRPKTRLCYWFPHSFIYNITLEGGIPYVIQTSSITVQDLGRKGAENIEIIHQTRPDHFQFFPSRPFRKTQQTMENTLSGSRALALTSSLPCKFSVFLACPIRLLSLIYGPKTAGQNRYLHNCRDFGQNGSIFSSGL